MSDPQRGLVTIHLFGVAPSRVPQALARMALDRRPLRATPGLRFFKLVGTGTGETFTLRDADPCRWGLIAVWRDAAARDAFAGSPTLRGWEHLASERLRLELAPLRSRGSWSGTTPFDPAPAARADGPVAALTRARILWRHTRRFLNAVPPVRASLGRQPGVRLAVGFGEAPVGLQGTLSVWDREASLTRFAYAGAAHREAIRRTEEVGWYAEELFARFAVTGCDGSIAGVRPLGEPADGA